MTPLAFNTAVAAGIATIGGAAVGFCARERGTLALYAIASTVAVVSVAIFTALGAIPTGAFLGAVFGGVKAGMDKNNTKSDIAMGILVGAVLGASTVLVAKVAVYLLNLLPQPTGYAIVNGQFVPVYAIPNA